MARRTGLRTARELTYRTCNIIATWGARMQEVYPDPELAIALASTDAACKAFVLVADQLLGEGV